MAVLATGWAAPVQAWGPEAPLPPAGVTAQWSEAGTVISWQPSATATADVEGYLVFRLDHASQALSSAWTLLGSTPAGLTEFTDPEVLAGEIALYRVQAFNDAGQSPPSQPTASGGVWPCVPPFKFEVDDAEPPTTWVEVYWWCIWTDPGLSLRLEGGG